MVQVGEKGKGKKKGSGRFKSNLVRLPGLYVDDIGPTSQKYIPMNSTVHSLLLRISFNTYNGSGAHKDSGITTSTTQKGLGAGGLSPGQ